MSFLDLVVISIVIVLVKDTFFSSPFVDQCTSDRNAPLFLGSLLFSRFLGDVKDLVTHSVWNQPRSAD